MRGLSGTGPPGSAFPSHTWRTNAQLGAIDVVITEGLPGLVQHRPLTGAYWSASSSALSRTGRPALFPGIRAGQSMPLRCQNALQLSCEA